MLLLGVAFLTVPMAYSFSKFMHFVENYFEGVREIVSGSMPMNTFFSLDFGVPTFFADTIVLLFMWFGLFLIVMGIWSGLKLRQNTSRRFKKGGLS